MATTIIADKAKQEFDRELKLHVNQQLFDKGHISKYMYDKAKDLIYRQSRNN